MEKQGSEDEQGDNVTHFPARVQNSAGNKAQYNGIEALTNAFEDMSPTALSSQRGQNLKKARVWNDFSSDDESDIDGHPKQLGATPNTLFIPDTPSAPTPPIADAGIIDGVESPLEMYYHDQSLLPPSNKLKFIMTVAVGVVDNFSIELTYPYSVFINRKKVITGFNKSKFIVTKKMVADEIKHRNQSCKLNMKSKSLPQLWAKLAKLPITNQRDINFIVSEETKLRSILLSKLSKVDGGDNEGGKRIIDKDKLRFILCLVEDSHILAAYRWSHQVKDREALDSS